MLIGGARRDGASMIDIHSPYSGQRVGQMPLSSRADCDDALAAAFSAKRVMADMPGYERSALLRRAADGVVVRATEIGLVMARESGKAMRDCVNEIKRSADTLRLCAEEAVRIQGEHVPMDGSAIGAGRLAMAMRFPVGVVVGITPFNGPVNLAAHKLGPALAAGNSIILKPSPKAPLSLSLFVECVIEAGAPDGAVNTLFGDEIAPQLIKDPRVDFVSFTGSIRVGKIIRDTVGMKRVALELGGVGPTIVHSDADVEAAAKACARNGMLLAGQSCVSVQNVFVEQKIYDTFSATLRKEVEAICFGDPMDAATEVGSLIDEQAAVRVEAMITRALDAGAKPLVRGARQGAFLRPSVLTQVDDRMDIVRDEVFGPAITVQSYNDHPESIFEAISASPYGLQCGIFTNSLDLAMKAIRSIRTGGVIVNGTSRWRSDQMPYGGVKDSGMGREGPKFSIREMTEERLFVIN